MVRRPGCSPCSGAAPAGALAPCVEVQGGLHRVLRCTWLWHACTGCAQQSWHDACHNILAQAIWRGKRLSRDWRLGQAVVPHSGTGTSPCDRTRGREGAILETNSDLGICSWITLRPAWACCTTCTAVCALGSTGTVGSGCSLAQVRDCDLIWFELHSLWTATSSPSASSRLKCPASTPGGLFWAILFVVRLYRTGVRSWRAGCGGCFRSRTASAKGVAGCGGCFRSRAAGRCRALAVLASQRRPKVLRIRCQQLHPLLRQRRRSRLLVSRRCSRTGRWRALSFRSWRPCSKA